MRVIAHRGFGDYYPENTVSAVERASEDADAVEIDVRRCGSGEVVVIHHDHVAPVTDSTGDVDALSASELASLSVEGSTDGVPRLEEVLDVVPPDTGVVIELKETGLAADVLEAVRDIENPVVVSALDVNIHALWETRLLDESVPLACILSVRPKEDLKVAELIGCDYVFPHWALCFATAVVERARERGMDVYPWPVSSQVVAGGLNRKDIGGLIATTPTCVSPLRERFRPGRVLDRGASSR